MCCVSPGDQVYFDFLSCWPKTPKKVSQKSQSPLGPKTWVCFSLGRNFCPISCNICERVPCVYLAIVDRQVWFKSAGSSECLKLAFGFSIGSVTNPRETSIRKGKSSAGQDAAWPLETAKVVTVLYSMRPSSKRTCRLRF